MTSSISKPRENKLDRRLPIGAEVIGDETSFRVWAPDHKKIVVNFEDSDLPSLTLSAEPGGYFSGSTKVPTGTLYRFHLDGNAQRLPDPASRFQPRGPHGPSQIVDPSVFSWTDQAWKGVSAQGQTLYELHIGTLTPHGTWAAAIDQLARLAELGITCIEVMPVADFPGNFGWGYDGVNLFAPTRLYGLPDDFRRFVDCAHRLGLGVILDVVYNHFGPDGMYLKEFSAAYLTDKHKNDWGQGINFDARDCSAVREYFISNARYWISEYHLDGFRFDATQAIKDDSPEHILAVIAREAREAAGDREIYLIAENEPQDTRIVRSREEAGYGFNALWNDDFHHSAQVMLSGHNEAYYHDFHGRPQEFISAAKWGYLFQGQRCDWQGKRRGTPAFDLQPTAFINYLQNHDQISSSARGSRVHQLSSPAMYRAMTALLLLMPQTPLIFQGQEFAASNPFVYFADHNPELNKLIRIGRCKELGQFPSLATAAVQSILAHPAEESTFLNCKLNPEECERPANREVVKLHRDLLHMRRHERFYTQKHHPGTVDGAVLGEAAFALRYFQADGGDLLIIVNFGMDLALQTAPEPLLAPPLNARWSLHWSSEDPLYGGSGTCAPEHDEKGWKLPGRSTLVLRPAPITR